METIFQKLKPKIVHYVHYTEFSNVKYRKKPFGELIIRKHKY